MLTVSLQFPALSRARRLNHQAPTASLGLVVREAISSTSFVWSAAAALP